jgi:hypothetical protein
MLVWQIDFTIGYRLLAMRRSLRRVSRGCETSAKNDDDARSVDPKQKGHDRPEYAVNGIEIGDSRQIDPE